MRSAKYMSRKNKTELSSPVSGVKKSKSELKIQENIASVQSPEKLDKSIKSSIFGDAGPSGA